MAFIEAPQTVEQIEKLSTDLPYPKLLNMFWGGKTPVVCLEGKARSLGVQSDDRAGRHATRGDARDAGCRSNSNGRAYGIFEGQMASFDDAKKPSTRQNTWNSTRATPRKGDPAMASPTDFEATFELAGQSVTYYSLS